MAAVPLPVLNVLLTEKGSLERAEVLMFRDAAKDAF